MKDILTERESELRKLRNGMEKYKLKKPTTQ